MNSQFKEGQYYKCLSDTNWEDFIEYCIDLSKRGEKRVFKIQNPKHRSLDQNDMKEQQVKMIAEQAIDGKDERKARNQAKYFCGVPILCRDDKKFLEFCEMALKHLDENQRIDAMEYVPVTRIMTVSQMREYINRVFDRWAESVDWGELINLRNT